MRMIFSLIQQINTFITLIKNGTLDNSRMAAAKKYSLY